MEEDGDGGMLGGGKVEEREVEGRKDGRRMEEKENKYCSVFTIMMRRRVLIITC